MDHPPASRAAVAPGMSLGRYRLLQVLGEGGMGTVYLAEQKEPISRRVALKLIKLGMDTKEVIARFESERQALALMSHPSIARVLDAGSTDDGRPFFVMEHVSGEPIAQYCDRHRLSVRERLNLFIQVCEAVQHAHQKAIIHRDLKPSNVLVTVEEGKPLPKVIDFGVAKAAGHRLTEKTLFTEMGQLIGTPEYMSPEQAEMGGLDIDTRTDIYSLGVLLYELLTGKLPFEPEELRRAGYSEIARVIREKEPPRPSLRLSALGDAGEAARERRTDLVKLLRELRGDLDWVVMKALEKDRVRRYATAGDLAADLERHLRNEAVMARPPELAYRLRKFIRKRRGPLAAAGLVALTLVAGLAATTTLYLRAEKEAEEKGKALTEKTEALRRSDGMRLMASSTAALPESPALALLLAMEAARRAPGPEANQALLSALVDLREERTLLGHQDPIHAASLSPDGLRVVTGSVGVNDVSGGGTVRVWDAETGKGVMALPQSLKLASTHAACFSSDGRRVLAGSADGTARIWDAASGKELLALRHPAGSGALGEKDIGAVAFGPDDRHVATGAGDGVARIWDALSGREAQAFHGHQGPVLAVGFSPDGRRLVTGGFDATARIWEAGTGHELMVLPHDYKKLSGYNPSHWVNAASFSPDGRRVLTGSGIGSAWVWDAGTGEQLLALRGHERDVTAARYSPDGRRIVTASRDRTARIWDAGTGKELQVLRGHDDIVASASFSSDGRRILTGSWDGTAKIWRVDGVADIPALSGHEDQVSAVCFGSEGKRMATGSWDGTARIWDVAKGAELLMLRGHQGRIWTADFSSDGRRIVTGAGDDDSTARVWDAATGEELLVLRGHEGTIRSARFSPDGGRVATSSSDGTARLWDAGTGKELLVLRGHGGQVNSVHWSPDGRRLLTASDDRTARVSDAASGDEILVLKGHGNQVYGGGFSRDGLTVLTCSVDRTARIWDAASGRELKVLAGHVGPVLSASFSPDGRLAMTCAGTWFENDDNSIRLWEVETGSAQQVIEEDRRRITSACFSPDGKRLATGFSDGTTRVWPVDALAEAERLKPRELTPEEVERYRLDPGRKDFVP